jgi:calcium binding protein
MASKAARKRRRLGNTIIVAKRANKKRKAMPVDVTRLEAMAEEATVDAYGESEQICGWACMLEEHIVVPFETTVLGEAVTVEAIEHRGDTRIVAICKRGRSRQAIDILELPLRSPPPTGTEWIEAYRHWRKGW